jgi:hypothetical protein
MASSSPTRDHFDLGRDAVYRLPMERELDDAIVEIKHLRKALSIARDDAESVQLTMRQMASENDELRDELSIARAETQDMRREMDKLRSEVASFRTASIDAKVSLMEEVRLRTQLQRDLDQERTLRARHPLQPPQEPSKASDEQKAAQAPSETATSEKPGTQTNAVPTDPEKHLPSTVHPSGTKDTSPEQRQPHSDRQEATIKALQLHIENLNAAVKAATLERDRMALQRHELQYALFRAEQAQQDADQARSRSERDAEEQAERADKAERELDALNPSAPIVVPALRDALRTLEQLVDEVYEDGNETIS